MSAASRAPERRACGRPSDPARDRAIYDAYHDEDNISFATLALRFGVTREAVRDAIARVNAARAERLAR